MQIIVSGKNIDVGQSLTARVEERLNENVPKYLDRVTDIQVTISRNAHLFHTAITMNLGTHSSLRVHAEAEALEVYASFESAATKVEKQLRRYKRKLKNHHKDKPQIDWVGTQAKKYVIQQDIEEELSETDSAPLIIAENNTPIETLTVSDAVMRMDLGELSALVFFSSVHGGINAVYRRPDGNIAWIDPGIAAPENIRKAG